MGPYIEADDIFSAYNLLLGMVTTLGGLQLLSRENILHKTGGAFVILSGSFLFYAVIDETLTKYRYEKYIPHKLASRGLHELYNKIRKQ